MTTAEIGDLIKNVGIPAAMLAWFALYVVRKLEEINATLKEMSKAGVDAQIESAKQTQRVASALERIEREQDKVTPPFGTPVVAAAGGEGKR